MYGLKVATLVQRNRESLLRMEQIIVRRMLLLARDPPQSTNIRELLRGRTISVSCRVRRLKFWGHIARRPATHILRRAMGFCIPGKKKVGRPCFTWHNSLARDIARSHIHINDWEATITERKSHEDKCHSLFGHLTD